MIKVWNEIRWSKAYDSCNVCKTTEHKHKSKGFCVKCYPTHKHEIMPVELCSKCHRELKGYRDKQTGAFVCLSCRASRTKTCYICEQERKIHSRISNGVYTCENCSKYLKQGKCFVCGHKGKVIEKGNEKPICYACDVRPPALCSICHTSVKYYRKNSNGDILCKKCYAPTPKKCIICDKIKVPKKRTSQGHICEECYEKPLRECGVCGEHKLGYKKLENGTYLCKNCYYSDLLEQELNSISGDFKVKWVRKLFFDYLEDKRRIQAAAVVLNAVRRDKPLFDMLGRDFNNPSEITAEAFWNKYHHIHRKKTGQLYAFLVDRGYIKRTAMMSEDYVRLLKIQKLIKSVPEGFRTSISKYYDRFITIRNKKIAAGWKVSDHGTGSYVTLENIITILKEFIKDLSGSGLKRVSEITASHVDDYIVRHMTYSPVIKRFLRWLYQEQQITWKYKGKWKVDKHGTPIPIHDEKYRYLLDKFLDDSYPVKESLICLLALVYGIRPKILRMIRVYDLEEKGGKLWLKLPYFEIELHPKIEDKMRRYLQDNFFPNPFDVDNPYLFYGYVYREPMDDGSIINILSKHEIGSHQVLPTVIQRLFNEKVRHPAVISKITGIHKSTAVRYFDSFNPAVYEEINLNKKLYGKIK